MNDRAKTDSEAQVSDVDRRSLPSGPDAEVREQHGPVPLRQLRRRVNTDRLRRAGIQMDLWNTVILNKTHALTPAELMNTQYTHTSGFLSVSSLDWLFMFILLLFKLH